VCLLPCRGHGAQLGGLGPRGDKTVFFSHLCIKTNILPRQARDKHGENSKKEAVLSQHNVSRSMSGQWSVMPKILQVRQFLCNCIN
jgi:hypothetical protein